jgi:hypothetical protein
MTTINLTTQDLNDHANDAAEIITKVYNDYPISYRIKDIIISDFSRSFQFSRPVSVTISSPNLVDGVQATATTKIIKSQDSNTYNDIVIIVTNPGSGYTSLPTITVGIQSTSNVNEIIFDASNSNVVNITSDTITFQNHNFINGDRVQYYDGGGLSNSIGGLVSDNDYYIITVSNNVIKLATTYINAISNNAIDFTSLGVGTSHSLSNNLTRITAVPVLEIDPILLAKRQQIVESINSQIVEESIFDNVEKLEEIRSEIQDLREVMEEIRDEFDVNKANNIASVIENIDISSNFLVEKSKYTLRNITNKFIPGERVTTPTGSGQIIHFDEITGNVAVGYISGRFTNGQTLTGQSSSSTGSIFGISTTTGASNDQIARGMMVINLKETNKLEDLRSEVRNPTLI